MDEFAELGPLDVQLAKQKEDSPDYDRESALIDEYSLKRIETRARELFMSMFIELYQSDYVPINKTELSKQIFEFIGSFYEPLLKQINPYKLGEKKRKLEIGEKYADKILSTFNPGLGKEKKYLLEDYLINECPDHGYIIDYDLISGFLKNVKKSEEIGPDYKNLLTDLSVMFLKIQTELNFVGFVEPVPPVVLPIAP